MKFLIISHVGHKQKGSQWFAYAPYVREMNMWLNHVSEVEIVAPKITDTISPIDIAYKGNKIKLTQVPSIAFVNPKKAIMSLFNLPIILFNLINACRRADHIHLRCPGNIGLLGCIIQIFFPKKIKTAKYAGNWDPKAKQPLSYNFQKWLLSNTLLTRNMQVLVYGEWEKQTKNIKPFFTATYKQSEIVSIENRDYSTVLNFVFIGSLVEGKRPLLTVKIIQRLIDEGIIVNLDMYGDGVLKNDLEQYILSNNLSKFVKLHGNQSKEVIQDAIKKAHFSILPSKSEGWPKAIAEAMFFGAIPIVTKISCVPYMLNNGQRGLLIEPNLEKAVIEIVNALENNEELKNKSQAAKDWSQLYTLDLFENEIAKLIKNN
ncbi:glycosyltransferase [uncultured Lacinutrix sp.]|uniref:glycosyltransferase family 4 protein n=1 Tax=uncultured Lacinutrix sp. TaxID=574032 RepID=UPI0026069617|nr:glycosyltransferase [uncultured Lacinutrix sp.]